MKKYNYRPKSEYSVIIIKCWKRKLRNWIRRWDRWRLRKWSWIILIVYWEREWKIYRISWLESESLIHPLLQDTTDNMLMHWNSKSTISDNKPTIWFHWWLWSKVYKPIRSILEHLVSSSNNKDNNKKGSQESRSEESLNSDILRWIELTILLM